MVEIILGCSTAVLALIVIILLFQIFALKRKIKENGMNKQKDDTQVMLKDGKRYSVNKSIESDSQNRITFAEGDIILSQNKTYTAKTGGELIPGKYIILCTNDVDSTVKIRFGGLVRDYQHKETIVLNEGDNITAVSNSVILR